MGLKKWFDWDKQSSDALTYAGVIGLHLVSGTLVGGVMGYFLDKWLGTGPWFFLIMLVFGIVAGFKNVLFDTKRLLRAGEKADQERFNKK
ncbi:AtpZ/AtpI family protein [Desulfovibrio litoralis]|uniref:ATP synthase protein I n=1 Tax=Desulfovibrio litoralis DSM 11393 TaxID=1121455 RepID=A0A1M7S7V1_9BACT|nr:AtpZ/AtpI family protein [Desulfovibrio litoralis]SHN54561.1 ATP synthase protein I [Desulfovibrio litoralis DSM 11393]